jgi:hypothetical protein
MGVDGKCHLQPRRDWDAVNERKMEGRRRPIRWWGGGSGGGEGGSTVQSALGWRAVAFKRSALSAMKPVASS